MHELGVVFHIIKSVERVAEENRVENVQAVVLEIGQVSGILQDYLQDCWKWAVKRTEIMKEAELRIEEIPAVTLCEDCGAQYGTVAYGRVCPECGSERTVLLEGDEVSIKELEAS